MSKHGTMDYLKYLGLCWCFAFASFAALADFTSSDSQNLSDIEVLLESVRHNTYTQLDSIWGHVADISSDTDDVAYDLAIIKENVHSIRYQGLRNITNLLADINSKLVVSSVSSFTSNSNQSYDSLNVHDVRNDDIYSKLGDIQQAINNLTNYFCYSPEYVFAVNTNFPFLFLPISQYGNSTSDTKNRIKTVYERLYGVTPTSQQINDIYTLVNNYDFRKFFTDGRLQYIDYDALDSSLKGSWWDVVKNTWSLIPPNSTDESNRQKYSRAYSYLYGTRELTETSIGISNVLAQINQSFSNIFNSVQGEYSGARQLEESLQRPLVYDGEDGKVKNDSGIVSAVVNLADDFCETIPGVNTNNIAEVNTNEIVNISDAGYQNKLNQISTDHITDNSTVLELQQAVDSINIQFVSFIPHVADTDELVLDFGTVSLFGVSKALVFTFQRLPSLYWTIQRFLFAFLKALMVFLAIHAIYHHIAVESPL